MNNIRKIRKEKGLTLKDLAKQLSKDETFKITPDAIAKYERNDREPKLEVWQKLADILNVDVLYLQGIGLSKSEKEASITEVLTEAYNYSSFGAHNANMIEMAEQLDFSKSLQSQLKKGLIDADIYNFGYPFEEYLKNTGKYSEFTDELEESIDENNFEWGKQASSIFQKYLAPILSELLTAVNTADSFTTYWTTDKESGKQVRLEEPVPEIIISLAVSYLDGKNYKYRHSQTTSHYEIDDINNMLYSISDTTQIILQKLKNDPKSSNITESTQITVQDIQNDLSSIAKLINQ